MGGRERSGPLFLLPGIWQVLFYHLVAVPATSHSIFPYHHMLSEPFSFPSIPPLPRPTWLWEGRTHAVVSAGGLLRRPALSGRGRRARPRFGLYTCTTSFRWSRGPADRTFYLCDGRAPALDPVRHLRMFARARRQDVLPVRRESHDCLCHVPEPVCWAQATPFPPRPTGLEGDWRPVVWGYPVDLDA